MSTHRLIHPALIRTGWISLLVGLSLPFAVSVSAIAFFRDMRCTTDVVWTYAPLLLGCEPIATADIVAGWIATGVIVCTLTFALALAVIILITAVARPKADGRFSALWFATTVLAVFAASCLVLAIDPDRHWGTNSWVFFSSCTALTTCAGAALVRLGHAMLRERPARAVPERRGG
jgi:hypothetical protein